ncbi:hypothetical protein ACFLQL_00265 [Verrucomicrobiota bacterium]
MNHQELALLPSNEGGLLYQWLGSFWSSICDDAELVNQVQKGNGELTAQLYQRFTDILNLSDRRNIPVFYRNRWLDLKLKSSEKDVSANTLLKLGDNPTPVIGPQTLPPFATDHLLLVGGVAAYEDITVYPTSKLDTINHIPVIVDNIIFPKVIYFYGVDFVMKGNDIFFLHGIDPFTNDKIQRTYDEQNSTYELTLWGCDALVDTQYLYNHIGYIFGLYDTSSMEYKSELNAIWDLHSLGSTEYCMRIALAAILGEPVVLNHTETIIAIITEDTYKQIVTDKNIYTLPTQSELLSNILVGTILSQGDFFTTTIKIFNNLDTTKSSQLTELRENVMGLMLPTAFFRASLQHGMGIGWDLTDIKFVSLDTNGNPLVRFDMYGNQDDIDIFWADVFAYCTNHDIAVTDCFGEYIIAPGPEKSGASWGKISPFKFFCDNMFKANSFVVTVDSTNLSTFGKEHFKDINQIYPLLPAHVFMFLLEKVPINVDNYGLDTCLDTDYEDCLAHGITSTAKYGDTINTLAYKDIGVKKAWVPVCST